MTAPSPSVYVAEATRRFDLPAPARPTNPGHLLAESRQRLLEQAAEQLRAATDPWDYPSGTAPAVDVAAVAEALADVVLVAFGTAAAYGVDLDAALAEVHRANLTQRRADVHGHARQGAEYSAPDVAAVLAGQRDGSDPSDRPWWAEQVMAEAATTADDDVDHGLADRWLDEPHGLLANHAPWEVISSGAGDVVWRNLGTLCGLRDSRDDRDQILPRTA